MFDHIRQLVETGVDSLKIEGRMKSSYYAAVVTRAYRKAIDVATGASAADLASYRDELFKVSHREFSTGFYFGDPAAVRPNEREYVRSHLFLGTVGEEVESGVFGLDVKNTITAGESIEYIGPDVLYLEDTGFELLDGSFLPIAKADHGKKSYIRTVQPVRPGYLMRKRLS